jgi:hypothetical protein
MLKACEGSIDARTKFYFANGVLMFGIRCVFGMSGKDDFRIKQQRQTSCFVCKIPSFLQAQNVVGRSLQG